MCYKYESLKISLIPTRLLKSLTFHFPLRSTHLGTLVSGFHGLHPCTPSLRRFGKVAKTRVQEEKTRGHSNITTRPPLKLSREHDKMKSQVKRGAEAALSIPVSHETRCLTRTQLQGCSAIRTLVRSHFSLVFLTTEVLDRFGGEPSLANQMANHH